MAHLPGAENGGDLDESFHVVCRVEEGKAFGEDGEEDNTCGPDINGCALLGALEEYFRSTEAPRAGPVGAF